MFRIFTAKDGKKIVIRLIVPSDLKEAKKITDFINSIIAERDFMPLNKRKTIEEEREVVKKWIMDRSAYHIVAEHNKMVVGKAEISRNKEGKSHVAELGILLRKGYREVGLGTEMMKVLITKARKLKLKFVRLVVFSTNKRAIELYKKFGFMEVARIPKQFQRRGKLIDEIIMLKKL